MLTGSAAARRARALSAAILVSVLVAPGSVEGFAPAPALRASSRGAAAASLLSARDTGRLSSPRRALLRTGWVRVGLGAGVGCVRAFDTPHTCTPRHVVQRIRNVCVYVCVHSRSPAENANTHTHT